MSYQMPNILYRTSNVISDVRCAILDLQYHICLCMHDISVCVYVCVNSSCLPNVRTGLVGELGQGP